MDRFTSNGCAVIREGVEGHYDKAGLFQRGVDAQKEVSSTTSTKADEGGVSPEEARHRSG